MNIEIPEATRCDECGALVDESYRDSITTHQNFHADVEMLYSQVKFLEERVNNLAELAKETDKLLRVMNSV